MRILSRELVSVLLLITVGCGSSSDFQQTTTTTTTTTTNNATSGAAIISFRPQAGSLPDEGRVSDIRLTALANNAPIAKPTTVRRGNDASLTDVPLNADQLVIELLAGEDRLAVAVIPVQLRAGQLLPISTANFVVVEKTVSASALSNSANELSLMLVPQPLPDRQVLVGVTVDPSNTQFTVSQSGQYLISYNAGIFGLSATATSVLLINDRPLSSSAVGTPPGDVNNNWSGTVTLAAGDRVALGLAALLPKIRATSGLFLTKLQ